MNIKAQNPPVTTAVESTKRSEPATRMQMSSEDRDADGRRERPAAPEKNKLDDQEFDDALKVLRETPGLKANRLEVRVEFENEVRIVLIVAPDGAVVRRLTEGQLWASTRDKDRATGGMLDRKM